MYCVRRYLDTLNLSKRCLLKVMKTIHQHLSHMNVLFNGAPPFWSSTRMKEKTITNPMPGCNTTIEKQSDVNESREQKSGISNLRLVRYKNEQSNPPRS